ncbi:MAG: restriction endonuclease subunit S [Verrucomicrobia bacterium]|nr:restriction endonuclease subunit S [Verrucomicrobiota bacterium]
MEKSLDNIVTLFSGNAWKAASFKPNGKMPIIRIQNIGENKSKEFIYWDEDYNETFIVKKGDLLLSLSGSIKLDFWDGQPALLNQRIVKISPKEGIDTHWLFFQLKNYVRKITNMGNHALVNNVSLTDLRKLTLKVPEYPDQLHIANLLSKAENLIVQRKESIRLLDEFLKSTFLEMFGDPEKNPKNLPFTTLEKLCSVIVDCPHSTPLKSKEATNYPCIRTSELTNGYISWDSMQYLDEDEYIKRTQRLIPEAGDIVYGREGTYGEAIRIPKTHKFSLGQRTMLFRPDYKKTNSIFLWAMVRSEFVYRQAKKKNSGSTVGHVNVKDIKQFRIFNPPIELQNQFAQIVEKTEALKTQYQQSLQELENLYGSLSQKAFRGEMVVKQAAKA